MKTALLSLLVPIKTNVMAVSLPPQIQETIDNIAGSGRLIGIALAVVFLIIAGILHMWGTQEAIEKSKKKLNAVVIGLVIVAGGVVIANWVISWMAF